MAKRLRNVEKERFWRGVIERHAASGLSVRAFCLRERLTESAFYAWRRTLGQRDDETVAATKKTPSFVPVVVTDETPSDTSIAIELDGGLVLRLPSSFAIERLVELVAGLAARAER